MSTPRRRAPARLTAPLVKANAKKPTKTTIDETKTAVSGTEAMQTSHIDTIEISSDEASDEDASDEEEGGDDNDEEVVDADADGDDAEQNDTASTRKINGKPISSIKEEIPGTDEDDIDNDEPTSPSFGELLRGTTEPIDITATPRRQPITTTTPTTAKNTISVSVSDPTTSITTTVAVPPSSSSSAVPAAARTAIVPPTHQSLVTVLSQALATDDTDLLESCLHTTDMPTIRNTIERIDSSLAGILLAKLAARLHRRPGRAGTLMTWVQWTLIAHGGALASQGKVVQSLGSLQKVLAERAKGLNSLLALKGKLDILEGQMELRRKMQHSAGKKAQRLGGPAGTGDDEDYDEGEDDDDDDEDEDAIYVEGEENDTSLVNGADARRKRINGDDNDDHDDEEDEDEDGGVLANGVVGNSEDEEEEDSDDAAEESDDDDDDDDAEPLDGDEVNFDDVDESMGEDEESEAETAAPPAKLRKVATKSFGKKKA